MMAKHNSPLRLDADLVNSASAAGNLLHRSTSQQIEQWASIGREVSKMLSPTQLLDLYAGLKTVSLIDVPEAKPVDPLAVIADIDSVAFKSSLSADLKTSHSAVYQASTNHPGLLEKITGEQVQVGRFQNGTFVEVSALDIAAQESKSING